MRRIKLMSDAGRRTGRAECCPARRPVGARPLPHRPAERRQLVPRIQSAADARAAAELLAEVRRWLAEERITQTIVWIGEQPFAVSG
jgi:hypothetical protein